MLTIKQLPYLPVSERDLCSSSFVVNDEYCTLCTCHNNYIFSPHTATYNSVNITTLGNYIKLQDSKVCLIFHPKYSIAAVKYSS